MNSIKRIHHISAIGGHPQETVNFYQNVLDLKLVKQTVNFDDTGVYHLYFAGKDGEPITSMTFFSWIGKDEAEKGSGQVGRIAFKIPKNTLDYWKNRLEEHDVDFEITDTFGKETLEFSDVHNIDLALVEGDQEESKPGILGFYGTVILSKYPEKSAENLTDMLGLKPIKGSDDYLFFQTTGKEANVILIKRDPLERQFLGVSTVHHVAFAVEDDKELEDYAKKLDQHNYRHTEWKDRNYFHSIYYREPGTVMFELATNGPGFTVDEPLDALGQEIQIPPFYEDRRDELTKDLPILKLD